MAIKKISAVVAACVAFQVSSTSVAQSGDDEALRFFDHAENFSSVANTGTGGQLEFIYKVKSSYSHYPAVDCYYRVRLADLNKLVDRMFLPNDKFFQSLNENGLFVGQYRVIPQVVNEHTPAILSDGTNPPQAAKSRQEIFPTGLIDLFIYPKWEEWKKNPAVVTSFCEANRAKIQGIAADAGVNNLIYKETLPPEPKVDCVNTLEFPAHDSHGDEDNPQERLDALLDGADVTDLVRRTSDNDGGTIVSYIVKNCDMAENTKRLASSELMRYLIKIETMP